MTGAGLDALTAGIAELLPPSDGDPGGPASGTVFKIERGAAGERIAYVRMFEGALRTRDRVRLGGRTDRKVTAISVFDRGSAVARDDVRAGEIAKVGGLGEVRIGDAIGGRTALPDRHFEPPTLETVVVPSDPRHGGRLRIALAQLAEQDPLIDVRQDNRRHELSVTLYGEVQKEVIGATLADEYGIDVSFRETTTVCVERLVGEGSAVERLGKGGNPFTATVGLRVEPAPPATGVVFALEVEATSVPLYVYKTVDEFRNALESTVRTTLDEGLCGWRVTDCTVALTEVGYASP